jgi:chromosome partitioning protein
MLNTIKIVQSRLNPDLEIEGILLTMFDPRLRLANQVVDEIKRHFEDIVYNTIIHRNTRLGEAPSFGKPAIMYDAESKGSINYMTLVREMLQRNNDTNIPNSSKEFNLAVDEETEDVADLN